MAACSCSGVKQATNQANHLLNKGDVITHINDSSSSLLLDLLTIAHHLRWIQQLFNLSVFLSVVFFKTAQLGFHLVRFSLLGLDGLRKRRGNMWLHAISVCLLLFQRKLHSRLVIGNQNYLILNTTTCTVQGIVGNINPKTSP